MSSAIATLDDVSLEEFRAIDRHPDRMDVKIAITTHCNARCQTCPVGFLEDRFGLDMPFNRFTELWDMLMSSPRVGRIILNNTGDMYVLEDHRRYFRYIEEHLHRPTIMQTNAELMDDVPRIHGIMISYNGGDRDSYEFTTGMSHDLTVGAVKQHYPELARIPDLQLHVLMCEFNAEAERFILDTWADFPGRIRISYKYDNQMKKDRTLTPFRREERVFCDYLDMLNIWPNGDIISCAHDFQHETSWGNIFDLGVEGVLANEERQRKRWEHRQGVWTGLCAKCNYNTPIAGKLRYMK